MPSYYYIFQIPYFIHDIESESFFQDRADVPAVGVLLHGLFRFLTQISSLHNDWVASIQLLVKLVTFSPSKTTKRSVTDRWWLHHHSPAEMVQEPTTHQGSNRFLLPLLPSLRHSSLLLPTCPLYWPSSPFSFLPPILSVSSPWSPPRWMTQ